MALPIPLAPAATDKLLDSGAINPPVANFILALEANSEHTIVVPDDHYTVSMASTSPEWYMSIGTTPIVIPTTNLTYTPIELNPAIRKVNSGDTLRFISKYACILQVSFYA